jgi:hypothetical protein
MNGILLFVVDYKEFQKLKRAGAFYKANPSYPNASN